MTSIYEKHRKAFANVSVYVIMKDGEQVANISLKYGNACTAYVHWLGVEMTSGRACGYGYDKASAACSAAVYRKHNATIHPESGKVWSDGTPKVSEADKAAYGDFITALLKNDGHTWIRKFKIRRLYGIAGNLGDLQF